MTSYSAEQKTPGWHGRELRWGLSRTVRLNGAIGSLMPTVLILTATILFHKSQAAIDLYSWLNHNYTPYQINAWWVYGITFVVHWAVGLAFMLIDLWDPLFEVMKPFKVQPEKRVIFSDHKKVFWVVLRNQLVVTLPATALFAHVRPLSTTTPLPGALETICTFLLGFLFEEIGFYVVHRSFHSRLLYKRFHKKHHEFTAPVALATTYCTMTEHVMSNLAPLLLAIAILRAHWSLLVVALEFGAMCVHSGYNIPALHSALRHDYHHFASKDNYGPTGLVDKIFGSDKSFRAWIAELKRRDFEVDDRRARAELAKLEDEEERQQQQRASGKLATGGDSKVWQYEQRQMQY